MRNFAAGIIGGALFCCSLLAYGSPLAHSEIELELGGAYRTAEMDWNIASDPRGVVTPNVLSALDWQDVSVLDLFYGLEARLPNHLFARIDGTLGNPAKGTMTDSDYAQNNRQGEIRRSTASVTGKRSLQGGLTMGRYFLLGSRWQWQAAVGGTFSTLELNNEDGYLWVNAENPAKTGPIDGLDSDYNAYWYGFLAQIGWRYDDDQWLFSGHYAQVPKAHYSATARWNLRSDLSQPKSFDQDATGDGRLWAVKWGYQFLPQQWLSLEWYGEQWHANKGEDHLYKPGQPTHITRLNSVSLGSSAFAIVWMHRW